MSVHKILHRSMTAMTLRAAILFWTALSVQGSVPAGKIPSNWTTYRSDKFGYELSFPAGMEYKAYFEGSSGELRDKKTGRILVDFEVWPADMCPSQPAGTLAREIGIDRAKTVTHSDGPDSSSYCGDPISVGEHATHQGAKVYELKLTCSSETYPESPVDGEDAEPEAGAENAEPIVKNEGLKGPTFFVDISQAWRTRVLMADPVGYHPLMEQTGDKIEVELLRKILQTLIIFPVAKPAGICIEDLRRPATGAVPSAP